MSEGEHEGVVGIDPAVQLKLCKVKHLEDETEELRKSNSSLQIESLEVGGGRVVGMIGGAWWVVGFGGGGGGVRWWVVVTGGGGGGGGRWWVVVTTGGGGSSLLLTNSRKTQKSEGKKLKRLAEHQQSAYAISVYPYLHDLLLLEKKS
ncbi:unnamed protein product [Lactuca virosa]|uniref:Uncharacterized protein n=1 Tax=Lactuca virosa TaxID=75947 RepID=A0AAU9PW34_9ASTR|nr:unnamed protein product [Lactuca virosa]